jgi:hypothetical protein
MPVRQAVDSDDEEIDSSLPDEDNESEYAIEHKDQRAPLRMPVDASWFAPGRDASGASERMYLRVAPRYRDWLASFANDKRFPFRGMNHLMRWCIDQGLRKLDRVRPTPTLSTQVAALQRILYEEQIAADFAELMQQADYRVTAYLKDGAKGEAIRLVGLLVAEIELMPDGYWKGRYAKEIRTKWGALMSNAGITLNIDPDALITGDHDE